MAGRGIVRGARIVAWRLNGRQRSQRQSTETHGALLEPLWNLSENIHVRSLIVETKPMHNFNDLMWWAHKDSNLGPAD